MSVILAGPAYKYGLLGLGTAFYGLRVGLYVGIAALLFFLFMLAFKRKTLNSSTTILSVLCLVIALGVPLGMRSKASDVPAIHDITTDMKEPPAFVAIVPLRADAPNLVGYEGEVIAKQQQAAYPELKPMKIAGGINDVFQAAERVIDDLGWQRAEGALDHTLEATETTFWFGFKDDVVIRLTQELSLIHI